LPKTKEHISKLNIDLKELADIEATVVRAKERITASFEVGSYLLQKSSKYLEVEIGSFPVSIVMVMGVKDNVLTERFALHEASRISKYLLKEKNEDLLSIAKIFNWRIRETKAIPSFAMDFSNYVKNATRGRLVHSPEWKLINRRLQDGEVYVSKREVCRLLQEEVRKYIEDIVGKGISTIPQNVQEAIDEIKSLFMKLKPHLPEFETIVKAKESEYPPCIRKVLDRTKKGQHLSHTERFTLVTYLLHQDVSIDKIVNVFSNVSDFQEKKTRYQVEHLAGVKGTRTKYNPYNCSTLKTHGVCPNPNDPICRTINNPLTYHLRKKQQNKKHNETMDMTKS